MRRRTFLQTSAALGALLLERARERGHPHQHRVGVRVLDAQLAVFAHQHALDLPVGEPVVAPTLLTANVPVPEIGVADEQSLEP